MPQKVRSDLGFRELTHKVARQQVNPQLKASSLAVDHPAIILICKNPQLSCICFGYIKKHLMKLAAWYNQQEETEVSVKVYPQKDTKNVRLKNSMP